MYSSQAYASKNFVLIPMSEIAADIVHPKYNKTVAELLIESQDIEKVSGMKYNHLAIEGNIGSGKTTLAICLPKI